MSEYKNEQQPVSDDLVLRYLSEKGKHVPISSNLERMNLQLMKLKDQDGQFVEKFDWLTSGNREIGLLLAHSMLSDYDDLGAQAREKIRNSFLDIFQKATPEQVASFLPLISDVSGRMAAGNLMDRDMKFFDILSVLIEPKIGAEMSSGSDTVLRKIQNDLDIVSERSRERAQGG